jgi:glycine betaine/proline transport system substrate-binding protein
MRRVGTIAIVVVVLAQIGCGSGDPGEPTASGVQCELSRPVTMAGLDWESNAFHTAVAAYILEHGYGCQVDVIPGTTIPLLAGMIRGDIDVTMEIWKDSVTETWNKGVQKGAVADLGTNFPDAVQGWFVPRYVIEGDSQRGIEARAPELKSVFDLPAHKQLFVDPEEPAKGRFYNCILGWSCEVTNTKKLAIYDLNQHYTNFRAGTGAALSAAIASAYKRGEPILTYYWGPTWILGGLDLVMLEEPAYDKQIWDKLGRDEATDQATAYPLVEVVVGVNTEFQNAAPQLVEFLTRYETSNQLISKALVTMQGGASADEVALNFLRTETELWSSWVPSETAQRVRQALDPSTPN